MGDLLEYAWVDVLNLSDTRRYKNIGSTPPPEYLLSSKSFYLISDTNFSQVELVFPNQNKLEFGIKQCVFPVTRPTLIKPPLPTLTFFTFWANIARFGKLFEITRDLNDVTYIICIKYWLFLILMTSYIQISWNHCIFLIFMTSYISFEKNSYRLLSWLKKNLKKNPTELPYFWRACHGKHNY